jgi:hypothetical protein
VNNLEDIMAKRAKESEPSDAEREAGIVKVVDLGSDVPPAVEAKPELPPPSVGAPANIPPVTPSGPSFGERVGRFFRFLLRLVSLLILLSLLSLALYLALPWLYGQFITPVQQNTAQIRELQAWQEQTKQHLADLETRLQTNETVQNQHDKSLTTLEKRVSDIEKEITARTQSLATLEQMQSELQTQHQAVSAELDRQINLLKAMELLSRARLFMYESNFGLARQDVLLARELLAKVEPDVPPSLAADLDEIVRRLDLTLSNLPDFPVAASDDLDIAWQILLSGLPAATPVMSETPTAVVTISSTATAIPTFTLTPQGTVNPSATP